MRKLFCRTGLTMVEIVVGALIISIILAVLMNVFGAGLRGSSKGMAHLTNMEAAAILMSQIEYDLLRASIIKDPACNASDKVARWDVLTDDGTGKGTVIYNQVTGGIERQFDSDAGNLKHMYCRGLDVALSFRHVIFNDPVRALQKTGMWVELSVSSAKKSVGTEEFKMKRLFICRNIQNLIVP